MLVCCYCRGLLTPEDGVKFGNLEKAHTAVDMVRPIIQGREDKMIVGGVVESGCTFDAAVVRELLAVGEHWGQACLYH